MGVLDKLVRSSSAQPVLAAVASGKVGGHAFLLEAENLPVARHFARHLATAFVCRSPGERPCRTCASCRTPEVGHVREIAPMGVEFRIQQIHQILSECSLALGPGERRVYVLLGVESMNEESANSFLKVLEEPPPAVVFLLATAAAQQTLPTIRSRCHAIRVGFPPTLSLLASELAASPVLPHWLLAALEIWGKSPGLLEAASAPSKSPLGPQSPATGEVELLLAHYKKRPAELLADPAAGIFSDLPHALDTSAFFLRCLGRTLSGGGPLAALEEAARILAWSDGLKEAVNKGLNSLQTERRKVYGPSYVHPLLEDDSFERSFYRKVTLLGFEALFRATLLVARAAVVAGHGGGETKLLATLMSEVPGLEHLETRATAWSRSLVESVEASRVRLSSNVSAKFALEAFLLALAPEAAALPAVSGVGSRAAGRV